METIGERVKALRKKSHLTQEELGEKVGRTYGAIASIERDNTKPDDVLKALAKFFKCEENWLLTGEGKRPEGLLITVRKEAAEGIWKEEAYKTLKEENQRLWRLIEKISGAPAGSIANFSKVLRIAGKQKHLYLNTQAA